VPKTLRQKIEAAQSWSVHYDGYAYDDARKVDGIWYYRDSLNREYRAFRYQSEVRLRFKNPPVEPGPTHTSDGY
jgi:hypothetical protein